MLILQPTNMFDKHSCLVESSLPNGIPAPTFLLWFGVSRSISLCHQGFLLTPRKSCTLNFGLSLSEPQVSVGSPQCSARSPYNLAPAQQKHTGFRTEWCGATSFAYVSYFLHMLFRLMSWLQSRRIAATSFQCQVFVPGFIRIGRCLGHRPVLRSQSHKAKWRSCLKRRWTPNY